jgi:hypothetical protein
VVEKRVAHDQIKMMIGKAETSRIPWFEANLLLDASGDRAIPGRCQHGVRQIDANDFKLR